MDTTYKKICVELNVGMHTSDGLCLFSDIYRPDDDRAHPAILIRQPYSKDLSGDWGFHSAKYYVRNGFAVVLQDTRGSGVSDGTPSMNHPESGDGYEAVEWVARQPWCSGKVCMMGLSYYGSTQLQAAQLQPPHLTAIAPFMVMGGFYSSNFQPLIPGWLHNQIRIGMKLGRYQDDCGVRQRMHDVCCDPSAASELPEVSSRLICGIPEFPVIEQENRERLEHIGDYRYWADIGWEIDSRRIQIPCLFGTGWYDGAKAVTIAHYLSVIKNSESNCARENSRLIIGVWKHGFETRDSFGGVDFGIDASGDAYGLKEKHLDWFRHWTLGENTSYMSELPVQVFTMGENKWHSYMNWPPVTANEKRLYLNSNSDANSRSGGTLVENSSDTCGHDTYIYDPNNPMIGNPMDPMSVGSNYIESSQERSDDLVYTSPVLDEDINVTGMVSMKLYASSSTVDTDFYCRLTDVYPNGEALLLTWGMVRARFRHGYGKSELIEPNKVYEYDIDLSGTSNLYKKGHRIRVDITSSSFPDMDRNHNTADAPGFGETIQQAVQTVYHGGSCRSYISLPVIKE